MKGLDFALLNKVRAELNKQKKVEEVQSLDEKYENRESVPRGKGDEITGNPMLFGRIGLRSSKNHKGQV